VEEDAILRSAVAAEDPWGERNEKAEILEALCAEAISATMLAPNFMVMADVRVFCEFVL